MLHLIDDKGDHRVVCSKTAFESLRDDQKQALLACGNDKQQTTEFIVPDLHCIELVGGGSARCMLAEIFYDQNKHPLLTFENSTTIEK